MLEDLDLQLLGHVGRVGLRRVRASSEHGDAREQDHRQSLWHDPCPGEVPAVPGQLFGGLLESTQGLTYDLRTDRTGKLVPWHIAGPTCDSVDVLMQDQMLPEDLEDGDFVYVPNAGAYTTAYASQFNGFPLPDVRLI